MFGWDVSTTLRMKIRQRDKETIKQSNNQTNDQTNSQVVEKPTLAIKQFLQRNVTDSSDAPVGGVNFISQNI